MMLTHLNKSKLIKAVWKVSKDDIPYSSQALKSTMSDCIPNQLTASKLPLDQMDVNC